MRKLNSIISLKTRINRVYFVLDDVLGSIQFWSLFRKESLLFDAQHAKYFKNNNEDAQLTCIWEHWTYSGHCLTKIKRCLSDQRYNLGRVWLTCLKTIRIYHPHPRFNTTTTTTNISSSSSNVILVLIRILITILEWENHMFCSLARLWARLKRR